MKEHQLSDEYFPNEWDIVFNTPPSRYIRPTFKQVMDNVCSWDNNIDGMILRVTHKETKITSEYHYKNNELRKCLQHIKNVSDTHDVVFYDQDHMMGYGDDLFKDLNE